MDKYQEAWAGEFGKEYTERCDVDYKKRIPIFKLLLNGLVDEITDVLEVGCNKGHNLKSICHVIDHERCLHGIDTNKDAIKKNEFDKTNVIYGSAYEIPWTDNVFDLVFTSGVLIHLPNDKLPKAMEEIYRVSSKYILSIEYFDDKERKIEYRDGVYCSAKPFDRLWLDNFDLDLVELGNMKDFGLDDGTDFSRNCKYAIFKKP